MHSHLVAKVVQQAPAGDYGALVAVVLVTGMSGTGTSTALLELARRGHQVVDTDDVGWSHDVPAPGPSGFERLWREDAITALLDHHTSGSLFLSGCVANQGRFYPRFDAGRAAERSAGRAAGTNRRTHHD